MLISVKCEVKYWRSVDLPAIQIVGRTRWGRVTPRGALCGWAESECGAFVTRFYDCERGNKDYSQAARDSIIGVIPASHVESIDPHFADVDLKDPLNFCRCVNDVARKDEKTRGVMTPPTVYAAMDNTDKLVKLGDGIYMPDTFGVREANPNSCLLCMAIEQKKDEAYIAALWNPHSARFGKAEWIFRGALEELRARQSEIRAAEAESASEHADGAASYLARVKAWLDAHVMESYARENVPLMSDDEAEVWRIRMVAEAAKATPWADPCVADSEAPKKRRRKAEEEVVAV